MKKGPVHRAPKDFRQAISRSDAAELAWKDITPLARNEWICWVTSSKKEETRAKRVRIACEQLAEGKRRPCCWPGCPHRK